MTDPTVRIIQSACSADPRCRLGAWREPAHPRVVPSPSGRMTGAPQPSDTRTPEPRWPALVAVLAVGGLYLALHANFVIGPRWLFPTLIGVLVVPSVVSHQMGAMISTAGSVSSSAR